MQTTLIRDLLEMVGRGRNSTVARRLADEIAQECLVPLRERVRAGAHGMSRAEIQGYAQAQAAGVVAARADAVFSECRLSLRVRSQATTLAVEKLVDSAVAGLLATGPSCGKRAKAA